MALIVLLVREALPVVTSPIASAAVLVLVGIVAYAGLSLLLNRRHLDEALALVTRGPAASVGRPPAA
jgi:hypothetical protein